MATKRAISIACIEACERIEKRIHELTGLTLTPLPRNHKDNDILRKQQLLTIADWIDRVPDTTVSNDVLEDAQALAKSGNWTKAEMTALLLGTVDNGDTNE